MELLLSSQSGSMVSLRWKSKRIRFYICVQFFVLVHCHRLVEACAWPCHLRLLISRNPAQKFPSIAFQPRAEISIPLWSQALDTIKLITAVTLGESGAMWARTMMSRDIDKIWTGILAFGGSKQKAMQWLPSKHSPCKFLHSRRGKGSYFARSHQYPRITDLASPFSTDEWKIGALIRLRISAAKPSIFSSWSANLLFVTIPPKDIIAAFTASDPQRGLVADVLGKLVSMLSLHNGAAPYVSRAVFGRS